MIEVLLFSLNVPLNISTQTAAETHFLLLISDATAAVGFQKRVNSESCRFSYMAS